MKHENIHHSCGSHIRVKCICDAETLLVLISTVARGVHGLFSEIKIKIQVHEAVQT